MVEAGGATPDRLFSYYVGVAGYNQAFNYVDNQNGSSFDNWVGAPMSLAGNISYAPTVNYLVGAPSSFQYFMGPFNYAVLSAISARDTVVNLHFAIPHKNDGGRDDVQVLWDSESLHNNFYSNTSDITSTAGCGGLTTGAACANAIGLGTPVYIDSVNYNCQGNVGKTFTAAQLRVRTSASGRTTSRAARIAPRRFSRFQGGDTIWNDQEIVKLQYTHNFGSSAFVRVYGYTYYSRLAAERPADHVCRLRRLLFAGLRADLAHARRQHPVPGPDQRSKPREPVGRLHDGQQHSRQQLVLRGRAGGSRRQRRRTHERVLLRHRPAAPRSSVNGSAASFQHDPIGLGSGHHGRRSEPAGLVSESDASVRRSARTCWPRTATMPRTTRSFRSSGRAR